MVQVIRIQLLAKENWVHSQVIPCEVCDGQSGTGKGVSTNRSFVSCRYNFQQCFILILNYLLCLSEGQSGEAWKTSKNIWKAGSIEHNGIFHFLILKSIAVNCVMETFLELAFIYYFWNETWSTTKLNSSCHVAGTTALRVPWQNRRQLWANTEFACAENPLPSTGEQSNRIADCVWK